MSKTRKRQKIKSFLLFLILFCYPVTKAAAQTDPLAMIKPMPELPALGDEPFQNTTRVIEKTLLNDPDLAYSIRIPDIWRIKPRDADEDTLRLSQTFFLEIGYFYGSKSMGGAGNFLRLEARLIDQMLSAEQFLLKYIKDNQHVIEGFESHGLSDAEVLYTEVEGDSSYRVRARMRINGNKLILIKHYEPAWRWEKQAAIQARILDSFSFQNPKGHKGVPVDHYEIYDIVRLGFPDVWTARQSGPDSIDRFDVMVRPPDNDPGRIHFSMVSRYVADKLETELAKFKDKALIDKLEIAGEIGQRDDFNFHQDMILGRVKVYRLSSGAAGQEAYELWVAVTADQEAYYFASLLTPGRKQDYFTWARNMNSFKLFVEMIAPL